MRIIKKIAKIFGKTILAIVGVLALCLFLLLLPYSQQKITTYISGKISTEIGLTVQISHIVPQSWKSLALKEVRIYNANHDTILIASRIFASLESLQLQEKSIHLKTIALHKAHISLNKDSSNVWNFANFLKTINKPKTSEGAWTIAVNNIEIYETNFQLTNHTQIAAEHKGIDFNNMNIQNITLHANSLAIANNTYSVSINSLSCMEQSGFHLLYFHTDAIFTDTSIACNNVSIFTPESKIQAKHINLDYSSFADFNQFITHVKLNTSFLYSQIHTKDIAYFVPSLFNIPYSVTFSGNITGRISDLKGRKLHVGFSLSSRFVGDIEISGLPSLSQAFIHINAEKFETTSHDIALIQIPPYTSQTFIKVPPIINELERFSYTGNFTGFINDFVAYGVLRTNAGIIKSDILIAESSSKNTYNYVGKLSFDNFNLTKVVPKPNLLGNISANVRINGIYTNKTQMTANIQGSIDNFDFNSYSYKNIEIDGILSKQKFDGNLVIHDPNIFLRFHGLFDYSTEVPTFKFESEIKHAQLYKLNLYKEDSLATLSFSSKVDFIGLQLDNLKGSIELPELEITSKFGSHTTKRIIIDIDNIGQTRNIMLNSELLDVSINAKGSYKELPQYIYDFYKSHIPSLPTFTEGSTKSYPPNFNLSVRIKNIDNILAVVAPSIKISPGSYINAIFSEESNMMIFDSKIPQLSIQNNHIENIVIQSNGDKESLHVFIECDVDFLKKIQSQWKFQKDSIELSTSWHNHENKLFSGNIQAHGTFHESNHAYFPGIELFIQPSKIVIADSTWNIFASHIAIDSTQIRISQGSFGKGNQLIQLQGKISENPQDKLIADFQNYNLRNFNYIINNESIKLEGALQGRVELQDVYNEQLIFANIQSPDFAFNGNKMGKLSAVSQWLPLQKAVAMNVSLQMGSVYIFKAQGTYTPQTQDIDYEINIQDMRLQNFKEIFASTLTNLQGYVDGKILASGKINNPQLSGSLEIKRGKFLVNITQTPYNFKGKLSSEGSRLTFYDLPLTDSLSNIGLVSGYVDLKNIRNPQYLLQIETDKLMVLNTKDVHNETFYGKVFYQGNAKIQGDLFHTSISAIGKTLDQSDFNIPLSYSELSSNQSLLQFSQTQQASKTNTQNTTSSTTEIALNLDVTPGVLTQIIFDKQVGDIIKVRGLGNLQMNMNKQGIFTMYGNYYIDEGEYLFTLKSLLNKKFTIEKGGSISWNGDPLDAQIDILAKYEIKASPQPIMVADANMNYSRRIPIQCNIALKNNLMKPDISYDIVAPTTSQVQDVINTFSSDEKNIQFITLLLMNSFSSREENQSFGGSGTSASFEVLSNQVNNLLSQINYSNVDVGINLRPSDTYSANEFELALSTQLLNNRILVNVNSYTEFGGTNTENTGAQTNDFAGDVSVEIKLNKQGTFRVRGFSRSNNNPLNENQGNTQGISLFFTREFNTLKEIFLKK